MEISTSLKQIDIHECHTLLLRMASDFDRICRTYGIPYYMLGGTMLGAVRHGGFIPWDDDMDFGIPRPYFQKFVDVAKRELPEDLEIQEPIVRKAFVKIQLKDSLFVEEVLDLKKGQAYGGLAMDVFPLDGADRNSFWGIVQEKIAFFLITLLEGRFCSLKIRKGVKKGMAFLIKMIPIKDSWFSIGADKWARLMDYDRNGWVANFYGHWKAKEVVPKLFFGTPRAYPFGNIQLYGVSLPHEYLTSLYGDYMQLPPEEKRLVHSNAVYVKR